MSLRDVRYIDVHTVSYIDLLLRDRDPESKKNGLQRLCRLYRRGLRLRNPHPIEVVLLGLLHDESPKVRRWSLNCLAFLGTRRAIPAIISALGNSRDDPDTLGAGVSALSSMADPGDVSRALRQHDMPLEGALLFAAAQHNDIFMSDVARAQVDIEKASPADLRFAMLLVGLNKCPENLFSLSHPNSEIIGDLNSHPDALVAQYSVWATCENAQMGVADLRMPLRDIESFPPNVRSWVYQLLTSDVQTARRYNELLIVGSEDSSAEAREGLSIGVRDIFFDSIERLVLDWFDDEETPAIRNRLLEHMAFSGRDRGGRI